MSSKHQAALMLIVLLSMSWLSNCKLGVYNWQSLDGADSSDLDISYSIANYGFAPFGKTIIGKVVIAPSEGSACSQEGDPNVSYENSFLLINRGKCEFVTKTLNAQKLGAQMAVIMDDKDHTGKIIMADNGYGYKVTIPSVFISHENGQKLQKLIKNNGGDAEVLLKITFDNSKTDKVNVAFYLQSNNRHSYRFVQNFRKFYPLIKDHIDLSLVYYNLNCPNCATTDCYGGNNYCAINFMHEGTEADNGRLILDQQIRQQIVYRLYTQKWWEYMQFVGDQCATISELQACQEEALEKVGINVEDVENQLDSRRNQYLSRNRQTLALAGVNRYPSVTLNDARIRGTLHAQFVFDDICNTLTAPPSSCQKYVENKTIFENEVTLQWPVLILVIALGITVFSFIFCFYRRYMKKKISNEMQGRVDDMVSKYIEFYSERNK